MMIEGEKTKIFSARPLFSLYTAPRAAPYIFIFLKQARLKWLALFSLLRYIRHLNGMWLSLARAQRSGR